MIMHKPLPVYYLTAMLVLAFIIPYILVRRELKNLKRTGKREKATKKLRKINFLKILDILAPYIALGLAIGWIGGFLSWKGYGKPADIPFAVWVNNVPYHPTQIYLFLGSLAIFFILGYFQRRGKGIASKKGNLFLLFLLLYSLLNFFVDFFRFYSQKEFFIGLAISQWVGIILIFISMVALILRNTD